MREVVIVGAARTPIGSFLGELAAPYDDETIERWITEVRPMVDGAA